jgi:hypothetical protein
VDPRCTKPLCPWGFVMRADQQNIGLSGVRGIDARERGELAKSAALFPEPAVRVNWQASGRVTPERAAPFYLAGFASERIFD